jgi:hypothetical protein
MYGIWATPEICPSTPYNEIKRQKAPATAGRPRKVVTRGDADEPEGRGGGWGDRRPWSEFFWGMGPVEGRWDFAFAAALLFEVYGLPGPLPRGHYAARANFTSFMPHQSEKETGDSTNSYTATYTFAFLAWRHINPLRVDPQWHPARAH